MADPGALVFTAQLTLDPQYSTLEGTTAETTNKTRVELTNRSLATAADRYVLAVMAWAEQAQRALEEQPDHLYAEQLEIVYDAHVSRAAKMAQLGYGGPTALSTFVNTLKDDVPRRFGGAAMGAAGLLVVVAVILALRD